MRPERQQLKKRTGTSKGLEAQTQNTCWQSIGKPGEVKLEREREGAEMRERGRKEEGRVREKRRSREKKQGGLRLRQHTHTHTPSPQPSVWSRRARDSMCDYAL